jgi:hypothetical protein
VSEGKGGGKYFLDVEKNTTLPEMHNQLTHKFFPDGKNFVSGLLLCELDTFLATFTGKALPERLLSGQLFTIGEFIKEMKTSPLRLYLHTSIKVKTIIVQLLKQIKGSPHSSQSYSLIKRKLSKSQ